MLHSTLYIPTYGQLKPQIVWWDLENVTKDVTISSHVVTNITPIDLNSEVFPYERCNLNFSKTLCSPVYFTFEDFEQNYYNKETS